MVAISEVLQGCSAQFVSLINSGALSDHIDDVPLREWTDELGRLRVWAANIGAHQTRQSSLDYRLRDASHIRSQIVRLLEQFQELLTDLKDLLEEKSDDEAYYDTLESSEDIYEIEDSTEIQEIHQGIVDTINQLYQLSMVIRKPTQHDRLVGTNKLDSEPFEFWAKQHTTNKYPNADELAIERISSAMARQRAILKYRERHHTKLRQGIDPDIDSKSTILSETVATDVFKEIPAQFSDMASDAGVSETSYGGTLLDGTGADAPKIPPIPKEGTKKRPFECPYCFYIISVWDKKEWARHIFRDVMPYICIFPECSMPNKLYGGRRQWYHHIQQTHASTSSTDGIYNCSICKQGSLPTATFQRHVGQHLEELALFLLPKTDSGKDEDAESDENKNNASLDDDLVERSIEERNAAAPASNSDASDDNPLAGLRNKGKGYASSVGRSLSDTESIGDLESDVEYERRASSSLNTREYELGMNQNPLDNMDIGANIHMHRRKRDLGRLEHEMERRSGWSGSRDSRESQLEEEGRLYGEERLNQRLRLEFRAARPRDEELERPVDMHPDIKKHEGEEREKEREKSKGEVKTNEHEVVTWTKVHRKHLLAQTVRAFNLPWDWDENDPNYIIIKEWVSEDLQEELFAHTRNIREGNLGRQISGQNAETQ